MDEFHRHAENTLLLHCLPTHGMMRGKNEGKSCSLVFHWRIAP